MAGDMKMIQIISKIAVLFLMLYCYKQVTIPTEQQMNYDADEVKDPLVNYVKKSTYVSKNYMNLIFLVSLLLYIVPPVKIVNWFIWSGLYDDRQNLIGWTVKDFIGAALCLSGYYLRKWSFDVLGKYFTYVVTIKSDHQLIKDGPYRYLIHPSYTGLLMVMFGVGLYQGVRLVHLTVLISSVIIVFLNRIKHEELALQDHFGDQWNSYSQDRYRLVPFIY